MTIRNNAVGVRSTRYRAWRGFWADVGALMGAMRFAVSLLLFIGVASIIGTVLEQNQPAAVYTRQFGDFWWAFFATFSLGHLYSSGWFVVMLVFLVASTTVCLIRNTPKMWHDARSFREYMQCSSLNVFPEQLRFTRPIPPKELGDSLQKVLQHLGFSVRPRPRYPAYLLAAKKGSVSRVGYVLAHSAIIMIGVGGLLDSQLLVQAQVGLGIKQPIVQNRLMRDVPASGRLSSHNWSFQASMAVPEGGHARHAIVSMEKGILVQPLPFTLSLKKFTVDYYATGTPSRFASLVEIEDLETGKRVDKTIEVNQPLRYKGVTVYQSGFSDGGSSVQLRAYSLRGRDATSVDLTGIVGQEVVLGRGVSTQSTSAQGVSVQSTSVQDGSIQGTSAQDTSTLASVRHIAITAFQPVNVEDLSDTVPLPHHSFMQRIRAFVGGAVNPNKQASLHDIGPSLEYRLTDMQDQQHEFRTYMRPVVLEGFPVFLAGMRHHASESYHYLHLPADENNSIRTFMQLRALLADPQMRADAVHRFVVKNAHQYDVATQQSLQTAAARALDTFAQGGFAEVASFLQKTVPPANIERSADVMAQLIDATIYELGGMARTFAGLPSLPLQGVQAERAAIWTQRAVVALSDLSLYPASVFLALTDYKQVQASVFQVSRTPGKIWVYVGGLCLLIGVFSMFYVRNRRVWVWIAPDLHGGGSVANVAMTSQRRTLDYLREFERLKQAFLAGNID